MPRFFRAPPRIPTRADIDAVLRVTNGRARDHLLVAVAAGTGLRIHELVALDWGQLVSETVAVRHRVRVRVRAQATRGVGGDVVLNEALRWKVARYLRWRARHGVEGKAPVFLSRKQRRISVRTAPEGEPRPASGMRKARRSRVRPKVGRSEGDA